ncbi:MAG: GntR family transcriptional regulator [Burkholderiales bacterium]
MAERRHKGMGKAGAEARLTDAVRTAILERRLAPGTKLQEIPLGEFFGVSRTIVRQALRTLAHEGIVALRDRRVAVVARPSAADVAHVFDARRAVEAAVVELVCGRATRAQIAALRRHVQEEEAAYRRGDRAAGLRLSIGFHRRLSELAGNPVLERYLNELVLQTSLAVALYERPDRVHAHADHVALLAAFAARDAKRATRLMREHLTALERELDADAPPAAPSLAAIFGARVPGAA